MLRPLNADDAPRTLEILRFSFNDLDARLGRPVPPTPPDDPPGLRRITHLVATDPGGAWGWEADGILVGAALALRRAELWGLSLLVLLPDAQSAGAGTRLLRAAVDYGAGTRGGAIHASEDPRALRAYWRAGFTLHPCFDAAAPRVLPDRPPTVRRGRLPEDAALVDAVATAVRGAPIAADLATMTESDLWLHERGGYAISRPGAVRTVAAHDEDAARDLMRAALAGAGPQATVDFLEARQAWAFDVVLEAGMRLRSGGALCLRGDVGPLHPYLPSGAYL